VATDSNTIVIGLYYNGGAVSLFSRSDSWSTRTEIQAPVVNGWFGYSVAVQGDLMAVGAPADSSYGAVYLYARNPSTNVWSQFKKITPTSGASFGRAVALSGQTLAVGQVAYDANVRGAVVLFGQNVDGTNGWGRSQVLQPSDVTASELFGQTVSLSGNVLAVGGEGSQLPGVFTGTSRVRVFENESGTWVETSELTQVLENEFGRGVATDGTVVAVSEPNSLQYGAYGAVYLYQTQGTQPWQQLGRLPGCVGHDGVAAGEQYGYSVAMNNGVVVVGEPYDTTAPGVGRIHVYNWSASVNRCPSPAMTWIPIKMLLTPGQF